MLQVLSGDISVFSVVCDDAGDDGSEKVQRLMALGFDRQQCMEVLAACNGNEEHAASLLFEMGGGLGF